MTQEQRLKNLMVPTGNVDVVLDTDAYNEIDDQFAITYLLRSQEKLTTRAIYAAPFSTNRKSDNPRYGMEKSYEEILKVVQLVGAEVDVFEGSCEYLANEKTYVDSPAAQDLAKRAMAYSIENPLYVVAIGAITNVASAILINPDIAERMVIVWLGGDARHYKEYIAPVKIEWEEFNLRQDVAAARVVMKSGVPFIQLPCIGVVSEFRISKPELEYWFIGKSPIATYLAENTINEADSYAKDLPWTRVIWDVTAVAYLLNDNNRFMNSKTVKIRLPEKDCSYSKAENPEQMQYVVNIKRDNLMLDLIKKLTY